MLIIIVSKVSLTINLLSLREQKEDEVSNIPRVNISLLTAWETVNRGPVLWHGSSAKSSETSDSRNGYRKRKLENKAYSATNKKSICILVK